MPLSPEERRALEAGARELSVELDEGQVAGIGQYLDLLAGWNLRTNLLATKDRAGLLERHIVDSLAAASLVSEAGPGARVLDIGSGGGLPGVPLAIACPDARITLLEPRRKKVSFLRQVSRQGSTWNMSVEGCRTDELAQRSVEPFDVAVSRAVFAPDALPAAAAPLVRAGGLLVSFTTGQSAPAATAVAGFEAPEVQEYRLPAHPAAFQLAAWRRRKN
ncbi:MAG: 16S rRNA (guanine(527)-N(7))-methyltransferase RsmG [Candidatus Binatia bacterium]|nr:16S rRNA (guanine(527)-N(7))-methyltransferase RsmG [Candidatus Binatia bacterium]